MSETEEIEAFMAKELMSKGVIFDQQMKIQKKIQQLGVKDKKLMKELNQRTAKLDEIMMKQFLKENKRGRFQITMNDVTQLPLKRNLT